MKNVIALLLLSLSALCVNAVEVEYKLLILDIPDGELKNVGVANLPGSHLIIGGEDWEMHFSDSAFDRHCESFSKTIDWMVCEKDKRIEFFDKGVSSNETFVKLWFLGYDYPLGVQRDESRNYVIYSAISDDFSIMFLVDKDTGRTIDVQGRFDQSHIGMLRLEKADDVDPANANTAAPDSAN